MAFLDTDKSKLPPYQLPIQALDKTTVNGSVASSEVPGTSDRKSEERPLNDSELSSTVRIKNSM